uniref:Uncharacterized protein n=1 Tax=Arundo donax TaxID=35708 RepID=A0A0A9C5E0_ARUDO
MSKLATLNRHKFDHLWLTLGLSQLLCHATLS